MSIYDKNQPIVWFNKKEDKSNQYCLYCGAFVGNGSKIRSNKEHLIGRQFVPLGSFQDGNQFNFIFRACERCNKYKSEIERHVSSVTMANSISRFEKSEYTDRAIIKAASDYHPAKPGVLVKDSFDKHIFKFNFGQLKVKFEATSPPQVIQQYIHDLSFFHVQGLFSLITSKNHQKKIGTKLLPKNNFWFHGAYNHPDWGNGDLAEVAKNAQHLKCLCNINTADGNFKALMCWSNNITEFWFWALEWNQYLRVVGGIASEGVRPPIFDDLPIQNWRNIGKGEDGSVYRIREEIPLSENDDNLFEHDVSIDQTAPNKTINTDG